MRVNSVSMEGYQVYTNLEGEDHRGLAIYICSTIDPLIMEVKVEITVKVYG